jgi:hypothetical protein
MRTYNKNEKLRVKRTSTKTSGVKRAFQQEPQSKKSFNKNLRIKRTSIGAPTRTSVIAKPRISE